MTAVLERSVDLLPARPPEPPRTPRSRRLFAALTIAIVAFASVIGSQAVRMRTAVARERAALELSRHVEAIARRTIASVDSATATANAERARTAAVDRTRDRERALAQAALVRIEKGLASTNHSLTSTEAARVQLAHYAAQRDSCIAGVQRATNALQRNDSAAAISALRVSNQACSVALAAATGARYPYDFPDPSVLRVGSRYYAYSTNSATGNVQVLFSRDIVHWAIAGDALDVLPTWAARNATWAPAVMQRGKRFVMYYTVREIATGRQCISVAVASGAAGPFTDASSGPLMCQKGGSIDPSPFVDGRGDAWLLWKSEPTPGYPTTIWSQALSADGLTLTGPAAAVLQPAQSWERGLIEGPSMVAIDGTDYLFYSANRWTGAAYADGIAKCDGPGGPCRRIASGPVLASQGRLAGPGGGAAFTTANGDVWLAFHAYTQPNLGYPNSRTLHFATVRIVGGVAVVTPQ